MFGRIRSLIRMSQPAFPPEVEEAKTLICDLCLNLYNQGAVGGTGGGISIKPCKDFIVMAPSGVQKERMQPDDMFVLDAAGNVVHTPAPKPPPARPPKLSECSPLFMSVSGVLPCMKLMAAAHGHAGRACELSNLHSPCSNCSSAHGISWAYSRAS